MHHVTCECDTPNQRVFIGAVQTHPFTPDHHVCIWTSPRKVTCIWDLDTCKETYERVHYTRDLQKSPLYMESDIYLIHVKRPMKEPTTRHMDESMSHMNTSGRMWTRHVPSVCHNWDCADAHVRPPLSCRQKNYRSLLQNIVSFIGLFCKRDL